MPSSLQLPQQNFHPITPMCWSRLYLLLVACLLGFVSLHSGHVLAAGSDGTEDLINEKLLQQIDQGDPTAEGSLTSTQKAPNDKGVLTVGPGFGAYWLAADELAYAVPSYRVRKNYPYNDIVIEKIRWIRGFTGSKSELMTIPIGNGKSETSIHFVYEPVTNQYGYILSNADDRHGSAHGLQVGVIDNEMKKPRIYLESSYYHSTGYEDIKGVSKSPDTKGFAVSYKGDLYFIPFGEPSAREAASVSSLFHDGYAPYFDDSTIKAHLWRKGGNSYYPVYLSDTELLFYDGNNVIGFNPESGSTRQVMTVGDDVSGMSLSPDRKRLAIIRDGYLLLYRITGELSETIDLGVLDAQYPSWSPDGKFIAFDDKKSLYVKILDPNVIKSVAKKTMPRIPPPVPVTSIVKTVKVEAPDVCHSSKKLVNIRLLLDAEIKVLSAKIDPALLDGLRDVSKDMGKLIACQASQK